jgi:L-lactate dehydrogenase complex protein LldE
MLVLFPTCLGDALAPAVVRDAAAVLRAAGTTPAVPRRATCCGQPAWNSGFVADARRVARQTLRTLEKADAVVVPAGSCAAMMRLHWGQLFEGDERERARAVSARVFEPSQYLVDELGVTAVGSPTGHAVAYHDSCHMLRELRIHDQPRQLLSSVAELVELPRSDRCCGFGGTFSVRQPEVSTAMADDKLGAARAAGIDLIASADPGCALQLGGRSQRTGGSPRIEHLATVLAEAL